MTDIDALNKLNGIAFSFYTYGTFAAANNLQIFDHLKETTDHEDLAKSLKLHPEACLRFLCALENLGLVEKKADGFVNSSLGQYLTADADKPMGFSQKDHYFSRLWEYLPDAMQEYSPRHEQAWGHGAQELYKAIYGNPEQLRQFFRLLDSYNWPIGEEVASTLDFSRQQCILDLAGGTGTFAATVVKQHPHLKGICLDLEPVRALSEETITKLGLENRFSFMTGDMFENNYPEGIDTIFLSYILHNWNDDKCKQILSNCYAALPENGMVVISEKVLNNDQTGEWWGVMMSLQMLVAFEPGAKERSLAEYSALLQATGFSDIELIKSESPRDILVAYKRQA